MDIIKDTFLCGIEAFLLSSICTILESSRFNLKAKQLFGVFLVYYIMIRAIITSLIIFGLYNEAVKDFLNEINMSSATFLLAYFSIIVLLVILACIILTKIRGKNKQSNHVNINIVPQNERSVNMFGEFITKRRKELGLSLAKLAKISGHPVSSIHGIENGDNQNPRFEMIIDLCQALDVSLDEMKTAFMNKEPQNTNHSTH